MGWNERKPVSNLVILGDDEGHVRKAHGLLAAVTQDTRYPSRMNYELVQQDGESVWLAGSASLGGQITPRDVGKFIKCRFKGWERGKNGKFKDIEVLIWDDEPTDDMKQWPRWHELQEQLAGVPPSGNGHPEQHPDDDTGLPF